jgi:hypothetical protein
MNAPPVATATPLGADLTRRLVTINIVAIAVMALHDADHVRQATNSGYHVPVHVAAILLSAYVPLIASIWWACHGHLLWATIATSIVTGGVLVLLSVVHLVGVEQLWAPLGDVFGMWGMSYWQMHVDAISWAAFALLALSYAGLLVATLRIRRAMRTAL